VHEGVTWFERRGSATLRFPVQVRAGAAPAVTDERVALTEFPVPEYPEDVLPPSGSGPVPDVEPFPMYAIPHEQVLAIIARHGGRLVHLEEDRRAGPNWVSYVYFVAGPPM
jgi:hypothetical protein